MFLPCLNKVYVCMYVCMESLSTIFAIYCPCANDILYARLKIAELNSMFLWVLLKFSDPKSTFLWVNVPAAIFFALLRKIAQKCIAQKWIISSSVQNPLLPLLPVFQWTFSSISNLAQRWLLNLYISVAHKIIILRRPLFCHVFITAVYLLFLQE